MKALNYVHSRRTSVRKLYLISLTIAMVVVSLFPLDGLRPAAANHDNMVLPWEPGETWHVCIGYDTSTGVTSHQGEQKFSLDLIADASDISGNGCKAGATTSVGKNVRAPTDGKLAWIGATQPDIVCVDTPDNFSLKIGHIILGNNVRTGAPLVKGDEIFKNQILGTVNVPAPSNNHIAHIHIGLFTGSGCGKLGTGTGVTIPFDNRFEGVSLPDKGTQDQYQGTAITRPATSAVDVFLLVDLSSSFDDDLPVFKAEAPTIISVRKASNPNIRFGLGKYEDYPIPPFGNPGLGDKAYERLVDLTSDTDLILATIAGLSTRDGSDDPESQLAALYQAATGEGQDLTGVGFPEANIPSGQQANFRAEAAKLFLLWTDAPFHHPGDPGTIPYPGPSFEETVAAINALGSSEVIVNPAGDGGVADLRAPATATGAKVIGISSGGGGTDDLEAIAAATDALAPAGGVDCNNDGIIDVPASEPLVCAIGVSGEGIAEAIIALTEAAAEPSPPPPPPAEAPILISPPDGQVFYPSPLTTTLTTTLQWSSVPNAVSYTVEIDCFHCCVTEEWCTDVGEVWDINSGIVETTFTFDFVGAQPGRWRVWAVFPGGIEGSKSDWWTFEYLPAIPGAP